MDDANLLKDVSKPADDEASTKEIQAAMEHQEIYAAIIKQQYEYAKEYADGLKAAIENIEESDQLAGEAVRNVGAH